MTWTDIEDAQPNYGDAIEIKSTVLYKTTWPENNYSDGDSEVFWRPVSGEQVPGNSSKIIPITDAAQDD